MARDFVAASSQYLEATSAVNTGSYPITMACWFRSGNADQQATLLSCCESDATTNNFALQIFTGGTVRFKANTRNADSSGSYSTSTWTHACGVGTSATSRTVYRDGANSGTSTNNITPAGLDRTSIGRRGFSTPDQYLDGQIAEAAIWDVALSADEVAILAKGVCPLLVRPANLVAYWPLLGWTSPEHDVVGGVNLTLGASPTLFAHPRMIYTGRRRIFLPASGAHVVTVNQATETDTAQAVTWAPKIRLLGQNTETDLAQALTRLKTKALGQTSETDTAQAVSWAPKNRLVNQVSETDTAQPINRQKTKALGQTTETDTAQALTRVKSRTLGQPSETDAAQPVTRASSGLGQAQETDTAQPINRQKTKALGQTTETDAAQALTRVKSRTLGQPSETDAAQSLTHLKNTAIGQASEADTAQALTSRKTKAIGQATETDLAQVVTRVKARTLGQPSEIDLAQALTRIKVRGILQVAETDLAQAVTRSVPMAPAKSFYNASFAGTLALVASYSGTAGYNASFDGTMSLGAEL